MTSEYMELDGEFHMVTRADGTVGIVPSLASIEATCQAVGIERMPDPCAQCAKCTALQVRLDAMLAATERVRDIVYGFDTKTGAFLCNTWQYPSEHLGLLLNIIRDAGKAVQP